MVHRVPVQTWMTQVKIIFTKYRTCSFCEAAFSESKTIDCIFFLVRSQPCTWTHYWNQKSEYFTNVLFKVIDLTQEDCSIFVIGHIDKILTSSKLDAINVPKNVTLIWHENDGAIEQNPIFELETLIFQFLPG